MKLYSYVVKWDTGFAPNPFWGVCTLACCKPKIRQTASVGDWVVGISSRDKGNVNKLIYAMRVEKILPFEEYFNDPEYKCKIPPAIETIETKQHKIVEKRGDNIYEPMGNGNFKQLYSIHSSRNENESENPELKKEDLSGRNVLISKDFYYFGREALPLEENGLEYLKVGRGHKCKFEENEINEFIKFIRKKNKGVNAAPTNWSSTFDDAPDKRSVYVKYCDKEPEDDSWKEQ